MIAVTEAAPAARVDALRKMGAEILLCGAGTRVDLSSLLLRLGKREICSLLVEGGGTVHFSFLQEGLTDKVTAFLAPKILGGRMALGAVAGEGFFHLKDAVTLTDMQMERLGDDVALTGYIAKASVARSRVVSEEAGGSSDVYRPC